MRHSGVLPGRIGNATAIKDIGNLHGHVRARRRGAGLAIGPARRSWRPYWTPRGWEPAGPRASLRSSEYGPRTAEMRCRIPYVSRGSTSCHAVRSRSAEMTKLETVSFVERDVSGVRRLEV